MPSHARRHDQFYTQRPLARRLVGHVAGLARKGALWLEPAAGDGAFLDGLAHHRPKAIAHALDIDPKRADIKRQDFLSWHPSQAGPWVVMGNPPFGKNASLAVRFFNHAASFADMIGMIFPRTFQKLPLQNRLDARFDLVYEEVLPPASFVFEGGIVEVPCVFQVWKKRTTGLRKPHSITRKHTDFEFVDRASSDFAFQRVGVAAGAIKASDSPIASQSHLFVRVCDRHRVAEVKARFLAMDWSDYKHNTAGNPSIGKGEIVQAYTSQWHA